MECKNKISQVQVNKYSSCVTLIRHKLVQQPLSYVQEYVRNERPIAIFLAEVHISETNVWNLKTGQVMTKSKLWTDTVHANRLESGS